MNVFLLVGHKLGSLHVGGTSGSVGGACGDVISQKKWLEIA